MIKAICFGELLISILWMVFVSEKSSSKKKVFLCLLQYIHTYSLSASVYFYWW